MTPDRPWGAYIAFILVFLHLPPNDYDAVVARGWADRVRRTRGGRRILFQARRPFQAGITIAVISSNRTTDNPQI